jgi:hypothetical protein
MKGNGQPGPDKAGLSILPKAKLIAMILEQREDTRIQLEEKDKQITELSEQLVKLQGEIDKEKTGQKIKDINKHVNQPTSKKPEWDIVHGCTGAAKHRDVRERPRTATQSRQQRVKRKSAKREPVAATWENPGSHLTRHISYLLHHALAAVMTWAAGKARCTASGWWKTSPHPRRRPPYSKR